MTITLPIPAPAPGLHRHVFFPEYVAWDLPSQSTLKAGLESGAHLHAALRRDPRRPTTDVQLLGSALHVAFLEPERMPDRVAKWESVGPDGKKRNRRGREWDAFNHANQGKYILTQGLHDKLIGMVRSLRANPVLRELMSEVEDTELSIVGEVEGVPVKGRCDAIAPKFIVDIKKVRRCDERTVASTVIQYGYDIQAWIYEQLFGRSEFLMPCIEDVHPFDVVVYRLTPAFKDHGRERAQKVLALYRECMKSGKWPGRASGIVELEPPAWATPGLEPTFGGERLSDVDGDIDTDGDAGDDDDTGPF